MQTLSGVNAVATPTGAPTCPPWVALRASEFRSPQCSGAAPPGRSGPQASTRPPPVTRHPLGGGAARQTWASVAVTVRPVAPTTSHVTDTSSHALPVRPLTLPVADAIAPGSSDAMVAGVVGTGVPAPVGGQVGSFVKTLSLTAQFARSAVPVFISSMSTSLLPLASGTRQVLVTFSPGVRHWNFAMSFAVARKFAFLSAVQKQLTVAVSGSLALSSALHVLLIGTGLDVPPTTIVSAMGTDVLLITVLVSVTVQLKSAVPPVFFAVYCTVSDSAGTFAPSIVKAFQPRHDAVPSSLLLTKPTSMNGPAPHLISLSICTLQVSHVSFAVAVSVF